MPSAPQTSPIDLAGSASTHCVVLSDRPQRPGALLALLQRKHVDVTLVAHPAEVMVALALTPVHMLIMHGPRDVESSRRLVRAVRRYHRHVVVSRYHVAGDGTDELASLRDCIDIAATLSDAWRSRQAADVDGAGAAESEDAASQRQSSGGDSHDPHSEFAACMDAEMGADSAADASLAELGETFGADDANPYGQPSALLTPEELEMLIGPRQPTVGQSRD